MPARLVSSLLYAVMLNVTALGGGVYSIESHADSHATGAAQVTGMPGMPGMNMPGSTTPHAGDGVPTDSGCRFPWSAGCGTPTLCAPVAIVASRVALPQVGITHCEPTDLILPPPASAERAPDHPPPRD